MEKEALREKIVNMRCRLMIKALEFVLDGYTLSEAVEMAEIQADDEDIKAFVKAGGAL